LMGGLSIIVPMVLRRLSTGKPISQNSLIPFILGPALTEPVAILGFVRVMSGAPIEEFYPFVGGAVVLMLFHFPRENIRSNRFLSGYYYAIRLSLLSKITTV
jgi:hypothetical protein